jgi:hypothetical protein
LVAWRALREAGQLTKSLIRNATKVASHSWLGGHDKCISLFAESYLKGNSPAVTIEEGFESIETLEQIYARI